MRAHQSVEGEEDVLVVGVGHAEELQEAVRLAEGLQPQRVVVGGRGAGTSTGRGAGRRWDGHVRKGVRRRGLEIRKGRGNIQNETIIQMRGNMNSQLEGDLSEPLVIRESVLGAVCVGSHIHQVARGRAF